MNRSNDTLESSTEIVSKYNDVGDGKYCNLTQSGSECTNGCAVISNNGINNNTNNNLKLNDINHMGVNGSITTMTLKNNHLIVETEERNVSDTTKTYN